MRVLICGSRTWTDPEPIGSVLDGIYERGPGKMVLIHGNARGADLLAQDHLLGVEDVEIQPYPAHWDTWGKAAGAIRNNQMLVEGQPDLVVAFSEQPITRGTRDMINRAKLAGVPVWIVSHG